MLIEKIQSMKIINDKIVNYYNNNCSIFSYEKCHVF